MLDDLMPVIHKNGWVTIPKHLRKRLNLSPGSRVMFYEKDNKLVMEPNTTFWQKLKRFAQWKFI